MAVMNTEWSDNSDYGYNIHTNPAGDNTGSIQGESKKSVISKSMYIALRAIKIKQIKF